MKNLRAIIVDDEQAARNVLSNLLELAHPEIEIIAKCNNLPEAVMAIRSIKPDVVFLDVEMPQFSGYEIVNFFDEFDFQIVFVTAYDKYAIKAFEVNAIDYLLKPVERKRLHTTITKVKEVVEQNKKLKNYKEFLTEKKERETKTIILSDTGQQRIVKINEISVILAKGAYSEIHKTDGTKLTISRNIGTFENELKDESIFFRPHRSCILNLNEIVTIKTSEESVLLKNGMTCKISRLKKSQFNEKLHQFLEQNAV